MLADLRDDQSGFGLIEVIVSAMLLVLVASGLYLGLDAASATSGVNKHRSIAAAIAQQDQDRMRAMAVGELSNYRDTFTQRVGPVTYTVRSSARWVTDDTGAATCTSSQDARAHYLRIASSVTWPSMRIQPVEIESIVAPPAGSFGTNLGSLAVQVRDRNGRGVPGVSVALAGARDYVDLTNELGCVLWGYLPRGSYTVTLTKQGYVDRDAVSQPRKETSVVGEATNTVAFDYDLGGRIQGIYETLVNGVPTGVDWTSFSAVISALTVPLPPVGDGLAHPSFTSGLVYPHTTPYGVYAGDCRGADPVASDARWAQLALVQPGGVTPVALRLPPVDVYVRRGGTAFPNATVRFAGTGGCGALAPRTTGADGRLAPLERAVPYGTWAICAEANVAGSWYTAMRTVENKTPSGVALTDATLELASTGRCP